MGEQLPPEAPEIVVEHLPDEERRRKLDDLKPFKMRLSSADGEKLIGNYEKLAQFNKELRKKYGAAVVQRCELLHFAIGSTLSPEDINNTFFDFTGEDSVEKYLRENYPE